MSLTYTTSHTTTGLLEALSLLFMEISAEKRKATKIEGVELRQKINDFRVFGLNVASMSLMGAALEGALTHLVSTELMGEEDPSNLTKNQRMFQEFLRDKIELDGGWSKTGNFYILAFEQTIQDVIGSELNHAVTHLFRLRNCTAHGTSIVYPDGQIPDEMKDFYPFSWQRQMKKCSDYLDGVLSESDGLSAHLRNIELAQHFWKKIQEIAELFSNAHSGHDGTRFFAQIISLEFGYRWNAPKRS